MQRGEAQAGREGLVQNGEIAEPDEDLGPGRPQRVPVEQVGHALRAVAAAGAQHGVDGGVAPGVLEVGGAVGVRAGQVAELGVTVQDMGCDHRVEVPAAQHVEARLQPLLGHRPAGGDDGDPRARGQPARPLKFLHGVSSTFGTGGVGFSPNTWAYRDSSASRARTMVSARRNPWPSPAKVR